MVTWTAFAILAMFLKAEARTEFFSSQNEDGVALPVAFNFLI